MDSEDSFDNNSPSYLDDDFDWDSAWQESQLNDIVRDFKKHPEKYEEEMIMPTDQTSLDDLISVTIHNTELANKLLKEQLKEIEEQKKQDSKVDQKLKSSKEDFEKRDQLTKDEILAIQEQLFKEGPKLFQMQPFKWLLKRLFNL